MACPFRSLLEPLFFVFGLLIVRAFQEFIEFLGNGEITLLFSRIDGQLRHPIAQHILRVGLQHRVAVWLTFHPFPPACQPSIPRTVVGLTTFVEGIGEMDNIRLGDGAKMSEKSVMSTSVAPSNSSRSLTSCSSSSRSPPSPNLFAQVSLCSFMAYSM